MAARLPLGEHVNVDGSNHWIMQQQPEIVMDAINRVAAHATKVPTKPRIPMDSRLR